jgi:hypothetical protein
VSKEQGEDVFQQFPEKKEHTEQVNVGGEGVAPLLSGNPFRIKRVFLLGNVDTGIPPRGPVTTSAVSWIRRTIDDYVTVCCR